MMVFFYLYQWCFNLNNKSDFSLHQACQPVTGDSWNQSWQAWEFVLPFPFFQTISSILRLHLQMNAENPDTSLIFYHSINTLSLSQANMARLLAIVLFWLCSKKVGDSLWPRCGHPGNVLDVHFLSHSCRTYLMMSASWQSQSSKNIVHCSADFQNK